MTDDEIRELVKSLRQRAVNHAAHLKLDNCAFASKVDTQLLEQAATLIASQRERIKGYEMALDPNFTKGAYIGEVSFDFTVWDPHGEEEINHRVTVPWPETKAIMKMIAAQAKSFTEGSRRDG